MNTKTKALTLLAVVAVAAVAGSLIFAMQPTTKADNNTAAVASDPEPTSAAVTQAVDNFAFNQGDMCFRGHGMMMDRGFGGMSAI
jgi:hypothetical protein